MGLPCDTTGELANLVSVADLGFMGKTLPPNKGGQTQSSQFP